MSKIESPCQMPMVILIWFHLVQHNKLESAVPDEELQLHHETSVGGVVLFFISHQQVGLVAFLLIYHS